MGLYMPNGHTLEVVIELSQHGARSSMAERLTVDLEVAGSSPVGHPERHTANVNRRVCCVPFTFNLQK